jgi:hypothetical protein
MMTSSAQLPQEWRFLLACAKLAPSGADRKIIEDALVDSSINWDAAVRRAVEHDIAPLVYFTLQQTGLAARVARSVLTPLRNSYYANAVRNDLIFRELESVLRAFRIQGVDAVALKGAALADAVYENRALRPMSDIDLLIRKSDVPAVEELLKARGYALHGREPGMRSWYLASHYHLPFIRQLNPLLKVCVEIHWHLEPPGPRTAIDIDGVWRRAAAAEIAGAPALAMPPEDLLLYLCLHTCKHKLTGGFRAFCDIAEVIRRYGHAMDWKQLTVRAGEWRIQQFVYAALHVTRELLSAAPPEEVFSGLVPDHIDPGLLEAAMASVLEDRVRSALFPDFFQLQRGRGAGARTEVFRRIFSAEVMSKRYGLPPGSRVFWYYPVRFKDLVIRYAPEFVRFMRQGRRVDTQAEERNRLAEWLGPVTRAPHPKRAAEK